MGVRVEKRFTAPVWDDAARKAAVAFWEGRGIRFERVDERLLVGRRGSLWGNLTSFDMGRLISTLTVTVDPDGQVAATLEVDTVFQAITGYNRAWWVLEMETFESYVCAGDLLAERWATFLANYRRAAWAWSLSGGVKGNAVPPDERP